MPRPVQLAHVAPPAIPITRIRIDVLRDRVVLEASLAGRPEVHRYVMTPALAFSFAADLLDAALTATDAPAEAVAEKLRLVRTP
jgi:hypothetical protein